LSIRLYHSKYGLESLTSPLPHLSNKDYHLR